MKLCAHKFEFDRQRDRLEKEMEGMMTLNYVLITYVYVLFVMYKP